MLGGCRVWRRPHRQGWGGRHCHVGNPMVPKVDLRARRHKVVVDLGLSPQRNRGNLRPAPALRQRRRVAGVGLGPRRLGRPTPLGRPPADVEHTQVRRQEELQKKTAKQLPCTGPVYAVERQDQEECLAQPEGGWDLATGTTRSPAERRFDEEVAERPPGDCWLGPGQVTRQVEGQHALERLRVVCCLRPQCQYLLPAPAQLPVSTPPQPPSARCRRFHGAHRALPITPRQALRARHRHQRAAIMPRLRAEAQARLERRDAPRRAPPPPPPGGLAPAYISCQAAKRVRRRPIAQRRSFSRSRSAPAGRRQGREGGRSRPRGAHRREVALRSAPRSGTSAIARARPRARAHTFSRPRPRAARSRARLRSRRPGGGGGSSADGAHPRRLHPPRPLHPRSCGPPPRAHGGRCGAPGSGGMGLWAGVGRGGGEWRAGPR